MGWAAKARGAKSGQTSIGSEEVKHEGAVTE